MGPDSFAGNISITCIGLHCNDDLFWHQFVLKFSKTTSARATSAVVDFSAENIRPDSETLNQASPVIQANIAQCRMEVNHLDAGSPILGVNNNLDKIGQFSDYFLLMGIISVR